MRKSHHAIIHSRTVCTTIYIGGSSDLLVHRRSTLSLQDFNSLSINSNSRNPHNRLIRTRYVDIQKDCILFFGLFFCHFSCVQDNKKVLRGDARMYRGREKDDPHSHRWREFNTGRRRDGARPADGQITVLQTFFCFLFSSASAAYCFATATIESVTSRRFVDPRSLSETISNIACEFL